ncbi:MAG: hypothetical protein ACTSO7_03770 [Candidatus Heimdallarchaeota archaeon]
MVLEAMKTQDMNAKTIEFTDESVASLKRLLPNTRWTILNQEIVVFCKDVVAL